MYYKLFGQWLLLCDEWLRKVVWVQIDDNDIIKFLIVRLMIYTKKPGDSKYC